jgi:prevent-host-death family protein
MISVGIRELKGHATEILRRVREEGWTYEVTYRGRAIAHIVPAGQPPRLDGDPAFWEEWRESADEISADWPEGVSALFEKTGASCDGRRRERVGWLLPV